MPLLAIDSAVRDAVVGILLDGRWPDRPARDPLAAVQALQGLPLAEDPAIAANTLPRKRRGRPRKRAGLPPAPQPPAVTPIDPRMATAAARAVRKAAEG